VGYSLVWASYTGMCGPKGCGFSAVLVINTVSILADFGRSGHKYTVGYSFCTLALIWVSF